MLLRRARFSKRRFTRSSPRLLAFAIGLILVLSYFQFNTSTAAGVCPGVSFDNAPTFPASSEGMDITVGDFNGDGKRDLATTGRSPNLNLQILLGNGNGGFANSATIVTPLPFTHVVAADFNGDGKDDLAATMIPFPKVGILLSNSTGSFGPLVEYEVSPDPNSIVPKDFTGDGRIDLAIGNSGNPETTSLLVGDGNGAFTVRKTSTLNGFGGLAAADFNEDGWQDLAGAAGRISLRLNDGAGNFVPQWDVIEVEGRAVTADLNNDGHADVISEHNSRLYFGNGKAGFTKVQVVDLPAAIVTGDFNKDGKIDLAGLQAHRVVLLLNNGDGASFTRTYYAAGSQPVAIGTGDFNGDNKSDLSVLNLKSANVSILLGDGVGGFAASRNHLNDPLITSPANELWGGISAADINGDGFLDVAVPRFFQERLSLYYGNGAGSFSPATTLSLARGLPRALALADFNGDGRIDIMVSVQNFGQDEVRLFYGSANGFGSNFLHPLDFNTTALSAPDVNLDNKPDMLLLSFNRLHVAINNGLTFEPIREWETGSTEASSVTTGDVNGDGKIDYLVTKVTTFDGLAGLWVGFGDGAGGVASSKTLNVGHYPAGAVVNDLNSDGKADIVVASNLVQTQSGATVLLGQGNGQFAAPQAFNTIGAASIRAADFNGDGKIDVALSDTNYSSVSVLTGRGDGTFDSEQNFGTGRTPKFLTTGDFNRDGKADLISSNLGSGDITSFMTVPCTNVVTPSPSPTPVASPTPPGPVALVTEPNSDHALAFDSVTMIRDPFPLLTDQNFASDRRTRIILFARNLELSSSEGPSSVLVTAQLTNGTSYSLPVEAVIKVSDVEGVTQLVVKLPEEPKAGGTLLISLTFRGVTSNQAFINIKP